MDLIALAKQIVEFRDAFAKETDDVNFINSMCGQYMTARISIMLTAGRG